MKVVQINTTYGVGSTGRICVEISQMLNAKNIENYILYTQGEGDCTLGIKFAGSIYKKIQALKSRIFGNGGFNSNFATKRLLNELDRIQPDIVHIHNIHGHDCNLSMLFRYLKKKQIKIFWTFHDCWAFTANCPHFMMEKCEQWKIVCEHCPQIRRTSWFFDRSRTLYNRKKKLISGLDLTIITPSQWLADCVKESFLKDYPVRVIYNGIDLNVFKAIRSDFRTQNHITVDKKVILGVAFGWGKRKGLDVFVELSKCLPEQYQIVLVGTDSTVDKQLPNSIISIHRTQNQQELAKIYSAADVFVNPTREEVFGLVNIEALACGTPGITFRSGGSPECYDETCGSVVDCDDIDALEKEIIYVCETRPYTKEACIRKAKEFDKNTRYKEYIELYERINVAGTERG